MTPTDGPWKRYIDNVGRPSKAGQTPDHPASTRAALEGRPTSGIGTVRYPRIVAKDDECAKQLKKRTLTNLYNERPTWLDLAHHKLDEAVFAAYGWEAGMGDEELLGRLLELNLIRSSVS